MGRGTGDTGSSAEQAGDHRRRRKARPSPPSGVLPMQAPPETDDDEPVPFWGVHPAHGQAAVPKERPHGRSDWAHDERGHEDSFIERPRQAVIRASPRHMEARSEARDAASPKLLRACQDFSSPNSTSDAPGGVAFSAQSTHASPEPFRDTVCSSLQRRMALNGSLAGRDDMGSPEGEAEREESESSNSEVYDPSKVEGKIPRQRVSVLTQKQGLNMEEDFESALRGAINFGDTFEEKAPSRWCYKHVDRCWDWLYDRLDSDKLLPYKILSGLVLAALFLQGLAWYILANRHFQMTGEEVYGYDGISTSMYFMSQVLTSAGVDGPEEEGTWASVMLKALYCGALVNCLVIVAVLVGFVTDNVKGAMEDVSKGHSKVLFHNHTLILGWSEATVRVIHQIAHMRETYYDEHNKDPLRRLGCKKRLPAASPIAAADIVLATSDISKGELEDKVRYYLEKKNNRFKHTVVGKHIIFRSADPTDRRDLLRVGADKAAAILVMMTEQDAQEELISKGTVINGSSIHTVLALRKVILQCSSESREYDLPSDPRIVVQLSRPCDAFRAAAFKAKNGSKVVYHSDIFSFLSKCLFSCATQPGLSRVLHDLLDAGDATIRKRAVEDLDNNAREVAKLSLSPGALVDGIQGMTLQELQDEVDECVLIGIISQKRPEKGDGLLPTAERRLTLDDILVYVSHDEMPTFKSSTKCMGQMVNEEHRRRSAGRKESAEHAEEPSRKKRHARRPEAANQDKLGTQPKSERSQDKDKTLVVFGWRKWWGTDTNRLQSVLRGLCHKDVFSSVVFLNQVEEDSFCDTMRKMEVVKFNTMGTNGAKVKVEMRRCITIVRGEDGEKKKRGVIKMYKNGEAAGQVPFDAGDNHFIRMSFDGGSSHVFESRHADDARDEHDFNMHKRLLVEEVKNNLFEKHFRPVGDEKEIERIEKEISAMLLPNRTAPHFLCGDDRVTWKHVEGDPADIQVVDQFLKGLHDKKPDVVVILSTQGLPERDEIPQSCQEKRMLVIMLQLRHLLNKIWEKKGDGVHVVVENSLDQTAELALGPPGSDGMSNPGVAADFLNSQAIQARALVQALANPDIHSCISDLWDEQENNPSIVIIKAGEILGLRDTAKEGDQEKALAFGVVQHLVASASKFNVKGLENHIAICLGYIEEATEGKLENVVLAPRKEARRVYKASSRLVCIVRKEDLDNIGDDRRAEDIDPTIYERTVKELGRPSMLDFIKKKKEDAHRAESARGAQKFALLNLPPEQGARLRTKEPKSV